MGLGMVDVMTVTQQEGGDAKAGFDLDCWKEGNLALANCLQALESLRNLAFLLVIVCQPPKPFCYCIHLQAGGDCGFGSSRRGGATREAN